MTNRIVSVHAGIYGIGIYAIMLPSSGLSVSHSKAADKGMYSKVLFMHIRKKWALRKFPPILNLHVMYIFTC